jgi:hypothetical protein
MDWETSNSTMNEISRIVWNYFQFKAELEGIVPPEPPYFALPPNYAPIHAVYDSFAANRLKEGTEEPEGEAVKR